MSNRPARRTSALSGSSSVQPATKAAEPPAKKPAKAAAAQAAPTVTPPAQTQATPATDTPTIKVGFYQSRDDNERMRGAVFMTMAKAGHTSISDFISQAVKEKVERLEAEHNGGQEFGRISTRSKR